MPSRPFRTALTASAASVHADMQIDPGKRVPTSAVHPRGVTRWSATPTKGVVPTCHRFKMRGVHARRNSAKMVDGQSVRDGSDIQFVRQSVGRHRPANPAAADMAIPDIVLGSGPQPAVVRAETVYLCPKTLFKRQPVAVISDWHLCIHVALPQPALVVSFTPATRADWSRAASNGTSRIRGSHFISLTDGLVRGPSANTGGSRHFTQSHQRTNSPTAD